MTDEHESHMREALALAGESAARGEVPVGCVVTRGGAVVGRGRNMREETGSAAAHAEMLAIEEACRALGTWKLTDCAIYVTLEPCPMCAGAVVNSRIPVVVFGARDPVSGSCGSVINLFEERYGHRPAVYGGVLERECSALLSDFFRSIR